MKTVTLSVSQKRLRDLAPRALRAIERNKELHVGIATSAVTLVPAAEAYIKVYDGTARHQTAQGLEMEQGKKHLAELETLMRSSLAIVRNLVPSFDTRELQGSVESPEQLISDGHKVLKVLAQASKNVPHGSAMATALEAALGKAEWEWAGAQAAKVALQQSQAVVREHAVVLNRELVALRHILRALLGSSHFDYQALRVSRIQHPEGIDEDDTVVEDEAVDPLATTAEAAAHSNGATHGGSGHDTAVTTGVNA